MILHILSHQPEVSLTNISFFLYIKTIIFLGFGMNTGIQDIHNLAHKFKVFLGKNEENS